MSAFLRLALLESLQNPKTEYALVVFAHGSGSSRLSPRDTLVATLNDRGIARNSSPRSAMSFRNRSEAGRKLAKALAGAAARRRTRCSRGGRCAPCGGDLNNRTCGIRPVDVKLNVRYTKVLCACFRRRDDFHRKCFQSAADVFPDPCQLLGFFARRVPGSAEQTAKQRRPPGA